VAVDEAARWLRLERGAVTVAVSLADAERRVPLAADRPRRCLLAWPAPPALDGDAVVLAPDGCAVLGP
jgi:hypothetical protein